MKNTVEGRGKRFLIIASVGDQSLHRNWITPAEHVNFDLCLCYNGNIAGRYSEECDLYYEEKDSKYAAIRKAAKALGDKLLQYDAVWMPDDSIDTNAADISRMFEVFSGRRLALAQPALTQDSDYAYAVTRQNREFDLRYVHFVEITAPLFSKYALQVCLLSFKSSKTSWGLDLLWPNLLGYPHKKIAIIDGVPVKHRRPSGRTDIMKRVGATPLDDLKHIERKYGVSISSAREPHYDGVLRGRKIIYGLLAHRNEEVLGAQIDSLRRFNPDAAVVLYNGGSSPEFGRNLGVPICPYSRPLRYGSLAPFMLDMMVWLEENDVQYDYFVNLDHDVLCIKPGFDTYIDSVMESYDCMGWGLVATYKPNDVPDLAGLQTVWEEWHLWKPIFGTDHFLRYFNPLQTYRKDLIRRILAAVDIPKLRSLLEQTQSFALEEVLFVTLAKACGARIGQYPNDEYVEEAIRWGDNISMAEAYRSIQRPQYHWLHPVKDNRLLELHRWLMEGACNPAVLHKPQQPWKSSKRAKLQRNTGSLPSKK